MSPTTHSKNARDPRDDYDSPWKLILARYLREAFERLFPAAAAQIEWGAGVTILEGELQALRPDADTGRRHVDQLASVGLKGGGQGLVMVHVEVQAAPVRDFSRRMFQYNTRLMHQHAEPVASFAILADEEPTWAPGPHRTDILGCHHHFQYPCTKLLALGPPDGSLFGRVLEAYRIARATRRDPEHRLGQKVALVQALYGQGFTPEEVRDLYTFIDWVLRLPLDMERRFHETLERFEQERGMQYVTTAERIGMEKGFERGVEQGLERGIEQGLERGIEQGLEQGRREGELRVLTRLLARRFGLLPEWVGARLEGAALDQLEQWSERVLDASSLTEVFNPA